MSKHYENSKSICKARKLTAPKPEFAPAASKHPTKKNNFLFVKNKKSSGAKAWRIF
jgi:hypothetical protein